MSTGPPKKPEGPPPNTNRAVDPNATIRGVGDSQKKVPPGPPPGVASGPLKPPPLAPPPRALLQTSQRPEPRRRGRTAHQSAFPVTGRYCTSA